MLSRLRRFVGGSLGLKLEEESLGDMMATLVPPLFVVVWLCGRKKDGLKV